MTRTSQGFQAHWVDIDPERMARYEAMYRWNPASELFYEPDRIGPGQVFGDFGCGPGHAAMEFARRVVEGGHIHAFDINAEFLRRTRMRVAEEGLAARVSVHQLTGAALPVPDSSMDRIVARNTLIYVNDPVETLVEFRRALRPGGLAHAIEGDWRLTAVEPVATDEWRALIEAASWAWARPEMGRALHGCARRAGFSEIEIRVLTRADTDGRLMGMIRTVAGYARQCGAMAPERIAAILTQVDQALAAETYLAISPQFVMTATKT